MSRKSGRNRIPPIPRTSSPIARLRDKLRDAWSTKRKPIERWLAIMGLAMAVSLYLLPKPTPTIIIVLLVLMFALLCDPVWNFWWIEKRLWRRLLTVAILASAVIAFGVHVWPGPRVQSNHDLKEQSMRLVGRLRAMDSSFEGERLAVQARLDRKEIDESRSWELNQEITEREGYEFDRESRIDAGLLLRELRNRIPPEKREYIVTIKMGDIKPGINTYDLIPKPWMAFFAPTLANEIEQLAKMLPED